MKTSRLIVSLLTVAALTTSVYAHQRYYGQPTHTRMVRSHGDWIVPMVVGGVIGAVLASPRTVTTTYVTTPPSEVIYAEEPVYTSTPLYEERWVYFSDCDCQRKVLVRVR